MSLTLALITDVHHGSDSEYVRGSVALPLFEGALEEIQARRPALLVDLGDRINDREPNAARAAMTEVAARFRALSLPRVHLQGNNDNLSRLEQEELFAVQFGNWSLELGGWHLIFLDTFSGSVEGTVSAETLEWLGVTLEENTLPAVVFSHQPLDGQPLLGNVFFGREYLYQAHPKGHEAARRILTSSGKVRLAVSGHAHWNHRVTVAGIPYLTLDALVPLAREPEDIGVYGFLTLDGASVVLEVFGRSPWRAPLGEGQL